MAHKPVSTSSAKQAIGTKSLLPSIDTVPKTLHTNPEQECAVAE